METVDRGSPLGSRSSQENSDGSSSKHTNMRKSVRFTDDLERSGNDDHSTPSNLQRNAPSKRPESPHITLTPSLDQSITLKSQKISAIGDLHQSVHLTLL